MQPAADVPMMPLIEIVVSEPLGTAAVSRLGELCRDAVALRPAELVIDLTACHVLNASGIDLLVSVHRRLREADGRLTLSGLSPRLYRTLELARVDGVLYTSTTRPAPRHRTSDTGSR
jgi:anti-anti-sigma factor